MTRQLGRWTRLNRKTTSGKSSWPFADHYPHILGHPSFTEQQIHAMSFKIQCMEHAHTLEIEAFHLKSRDVQGTLKWQDAGCYLKEVLLPPPPTPTSSPAASSPLPPSPWPIRLPQPSHLPAAQQDPVSRHDDSVQRDVDGAQPLAHAVDGARLVVNLPRHQCNGMR